MPVKISPSPICRQSFCKVITAEAAKDSDQKYWQTTAMLDKKYTEHVAWMKELDAAYKAFLAEKFPDPKTRPNIPMIGHPKSPVKDGDTATDSNGFLLKEKYPEYEGHWLVRGAAKDDGKPRRHVVIGNQKVNGAWNRITEDSEVYSGCWGRVLLNMYWRKVASNPGVSFGLQGFQKTRDDEPFGSTVSDKDFDDAGANDPNNYAADPFADGGGIPF